MAPDRTVVLSLFITLGVISVLMVLLTSRATMAEGSYRLMTWQPLLLLRMTSSRLVKSRLVTIR